MAKVEFDLRNPDDQINFDRFHGLSPSDGSLLEERRSRRHEYPRMQLVAQLAGNTMPEVNAFTPVWCHDVSNHGISYFCTSTPDTARLAFLFVGGDELLCLEARVIHVQPAYGDHQRQFLVACEFTGRTLLHESRPNPKLEAQLTLAAT